MDSHQQSTQTQEYLPRAGRPSLYDPAKLGEYRDAMIRVASEGGHQAAMCLAIGIRSRDTFNQWRKEYPEFKDVCDEAHLVSLAHHEHMGYLGTKGDLPKFNATSWAMTMNNKFRDEGYSRSETAVGDVHIGTIQITQDNRGKYLEQLKTMLEKRPDLLEHIGHKDVDG